MEMTLIQQHELYGMCFKHRCCVNSGTQVTPGCGKCFQQWGGQAASPHPVLCRLMGKPWQGKRAHGSAAHHRLQVQCIKAAIAISSSTILDWVNRDDGLLILRCSSQR